MEGALSSTSEGTDKTMLGTAQTAASSERMISALDLPAGDDALALMASRHSVRCFTDEPLSDDEVRVLQEAVEACNAASGLSIRLVTNEPDAFRCLTAHYGKFRGVTSYLIMAGEPNAAGAVDSTPTAADRTPNADPATAAAASAPTASLEERVGFWGQELVLLAQSMGLRTCWVALTFAKRKVQETLPDNVEMPCVIALGHGASDGKPHKSKAPKKISNLDANSPTWFARGVQAALLAPTAINQQSFFLELLTEDGGHRVRATDKGGPYSGIDIGIVKHDFALAAGPENFTWV